ncbi:HEPN domain-containing protein [Corynebacterium glucuronolyticum]|uniref:ApeA N-terminal domain 1-containing protein n=1 Tax=Corynebacterium glucuronolyticum TaxID=39791 RepID=UPI00019C191C|nr:HEPN domain-containing protein [Corynebacterium glucuronolyticum]EEI27828.1 hypothetical protein HMPREF0294_0684 [Corynebacterium glucuronolyticum ATCC 51867]QRO82080.1 hypothetical protein I6J20_09430 [Corynebacterium glucuronolyticum]
MLNFSRSYEWIGLWWLPDEPDIKFYGALTYAPDSGLLLKLNGGFNDWEREPSGYGTILLKMRSEPWRTIHGRSLGKSITLFEGVAIHSTGMPGRATPQYQEIHIGSALFGVHISSIDDQVIEEIAVQHDHLNTWACYSGLFQKQPKNATDPEYKAVAGVQRKEPFKAHSKDIEFVLEQIIHPPTFVTKSGNETNEVGESWTFRMKKIKGAWSYDDVFDLYRLPADLVSLSTHHSIGLLTLQANVQVPKDSGDSKDPETAYCDLLFEPPLIGSPEADGLEYYQRICNCENLDFAFAVPRWQELRSDARSVVGILIALKVKGRNIIENTLFMAIGAAESYHRKFLPQKAPFDRGEFKENRALAVKSVPDDFGKFLKKAVRNEPTLRQRLQDLAAELDETVREKILGDVDTWSAMATKVRNSIAHEGTTEEYSYDQVVAIRNSTELLVSMLFLQELGLSIEDQIKALETHRALRNVCFTAQRVFRPKEEQLKSTYRE